MREGKSMESIKISEDYNEMVEIGRGLFENHREKYTDTLLTIIRGCISECFSDVSSFEIEQIFYISIYNYWVYGCTYEEFLKYDFLHKTHDEKMTYMTFRVRLQYIDHINSSKDKHVLFNKFETYKRFRNEFSRDVILCRSMDDYPVFRNFINKHREFVIKPIDLSCGKGVRKLFASSLEDAELKKLLSSILDEIKTCESAYSKNSEKTVVIEELIDQDERMAVFNPESINAIRLTTVRTGSEIKAYHPWFKIGCGGHFLTSASFGTMVAGVNSQTGIVETPGFKENGEKWIKHPDSQIAILGFKIPEWDTLLSFANECAEKIPEMSYVGWDFALTPKGWCIMEGNYSGDFNWQVFYEKGMKKEFEDLIGWKLEKDFWWR